MPSEVSTCDVLERRCCVTRRSLKNRVGVGYRGEGGEGGEHFVQYTTCKRQN